MRIAIVDDNREILEIVQLMVVKHATIRLEKCDVFQRPQGLLGRLEDGQLYDVYLLDIEMPDINGLELARQIRALQEDACIVFITSHPNFALTSYDLRIRAYQYIIKDELEERFPEIMEKISSEMNGKKEEYYFIKNNVRYEKIRLVDIMHIYKNGKNSVFVTMEKEYKDRRALRNVIELLRAPEFIFVDNGRIVNIRYIDSVDKDSITLSDGTKLYASYSNIRKVKEKIADYWGALL